MLMELVNVTNSRSINDNAAFCHRHHIHLTFCRKMISKPSSLPAQVCTRSNGTDKSIKSLIKATYQHFNHRKILYVTPTEPLISDVSTIRPNVAVISKSESSNFVQIAR